MKWIYRGVLVLVVFASGAFAYEAFAPASPNGVQESIETFIEEVATSDTLPETRILVTVYDGVSVADTTSTLDLSNRGLTGSLKAEIRQLTKLKTLNLSNNQFTGLPAEVGQLRELEVLNLSGNPLTGLPHELGNLSSLKVLDIRGTTYSKADLEIIRQKLPPTTQILKD